MLEAASAAPGSSLFNLLITRTSAIGVFPLMKENTAFLLESTHGYGVLSARTAEGWTGPLFYQLGSVHYRGILVKGGRYGVILLFIDKNSVPKCGKENVTLHPAKNLRPGPMTKESEDAGKALYSEGIAAYVYFEGRLLSAPPRQKDWKEFTLNDRDGLNKRLYGIRTCENLAGRKPKTFPATLKAFQDLLNGKFRSASDSILN